jgi:DNA modification methylase
MNAVHSMESWPIERLKPFQGNLKKVDQSWIQALANRIQRKGFSAPFLVWKDHDLLLDGHQRLEALKLLKWTEPVPVVLIEAKDEAEAKERLLEYNTTYSKIDEDVFDDWSEDLDLDDLNLIGMESLDETPTVLPEGIDDAPALPTTPKTKLGDLYQLGNHRVLCGDSTKREDVERLMDGQQAEICFTSPPYNVGKNASLSPHQENGAKYTNDLDDKTQDEYLSLLSDFTTLALKYSKFVFVNIQSLSGNKLSLIKYLSAHNESFADILVWDKLTPQPAMASNVLNSRFEFIYVFSHTGTRAIGTRPFRGTIDNLIRLDSHQGKEYAKQHSATFPVAFAQFFVENFTNSNTILPNVYDPFGGSGSTLIACEQTNRINFTMEIDPGYVSVILDRWANLTGKDPIRLQDGKAWSTIKNDG